MIPMPHKHNADRRHHIPKMAFKVQNWPASAWCTDIPRDLSSIYGAATVGVAAKIRDSRTPNFE
jgi:hypothetical protein